MHTQAGYSTARELREATRAGRFTGSTAGHAAGHVQANLVVLPESYAAEFAEFCRLNDRPCPVIAQTEPGQFEPTDVSPGADLRTDLPCYRVFRNGCWDTELPTDIRNFWRDDFVAFLLGCSFTFEKALATHGLRVRHIDEGRNVPMYATSVQCRAAGRFAGPLVVSMRPFAIEDIDRVIEITSRFPKVHGAPLHVGDPSVLGIADLGRPEFGEPVTVHDHELPVFWACGVTPQLAIERARCEIAIAHSPGCMFVTDLRDEMFCEPAI